MAKHVTVRFGGGNTVVEPFRVTGYADIRTPGLPTDALVSPGRVVGSAAIPIPTSPDPETQYPNTVVGSAKVIVPTIIIGPGEEYVQRTKLWFTSGSYWRTPLPDDATIHSNSAAILKYIAVDGDDPSPYLNLTLASWSMPVYWAVPTDPVYNVPWTAYGAQRPPEHNAMRIPYGATPASTSDAAMVVYDVEKGWVSSFHGATYNAGTDKWSTLGGSFAILGSNGLDYRVTTAPWHEGSNNTKNRGSLRGNNGTVMYVSWEQVKAAISSGGDLGHVVKISMSSLFREDAIPPTIGSDGNLPTGSPWYSVAPKNGTRLRIKPSVVLTGKGLSQASLVIARTLQNYGMYIGDSSSNSSLKMEDMTVRDDLSGVHTWASLGLASNDMEIFPFTRDWEVISETYWP